MRETGRSTRLFHAIVGMGLGAAAVGCGGQTTTRDPVGLLDAGDGAVGTPDAPEEDHGDATPDSQDAAGQPDMGGAIVIGTPDAGSDHWVPRPPVIA